MENHFTVVVLFDYFGFLDNIKISILVFSSMGNSNWIEAMNMNKGALTKKAQAAGMSTSAFAKKNKTSGGKLGKQSNLANTLARLRKKGALQ